MRQVDILDYLRGVYPEYRCTMDVVRDLAGDHESYRTSHLRGDVSNKLSKLVRFGLVERQELPDHRVRYRWVPDKDSEVTG